MGSVRITFYMLVISSAVTHGEEMKDTDTYISTFLADLWLESADIVKILWRDCSKKLLDDKDITDRKEYYPKFVRCMKRKTLRALDRSLSFDEVPVADGVTLVRYDLVDRAGNIVSESHNSTWSEKELEEGEWRTLALQRIAQVLRTHVIKFDLDLDQAVGKVEYRGRRRHHMMTMMMYGIVSIGMVLIPMGFQFLAVLGGKALLLAKMALILASIQGLKKIATSPLSYGFYHTYPYDHYDKRSNDNWMQLRVPSRKNFAQLSTNVESSEVEKFNYRSMNDIETVTWKPSESRIIHNM
ncbi:uncharacterized protein LOC126965198 [Leptidea sinapis]|uniref:uncharacterized protein LOC126965198 n=1 Tax=Leptidea sinapis TaxID=189913 RepID=UPI0021C288C1|nr:uncharacterized protein LOC126965198 [Leptidea sinapis]